MSRNLKKFAGCGARPAIQYVLNTRTPINTRVEGRANLRDTHMVDTTRVGMMRSGTTSKRRRTNSQAVGLLQGAHKKDVCVRTKFCVTHPGLNK